MALRRKSKEANADDMVFRYMGEMEMRLLTTGKPITNTTNHSLTRGTASNARGFCFGIGGALAALKSLRRLHGIVDDGYLLIALPKSTMHFNACRGRYVNYKKVDNAGGIEKFPIGKAPQKHFDELCLEEYSVNDFEWCMIMSVAGYDHAHKMAIVGGVMYQAAEKKKIESYE